MVILIIILILLIALKSGGAATKTLDIIVPRELNKIYDRTIYPEFCKNSSPEFNLTIPDYPPGVKDYFKEDIFNRVVFNPFRKNCLFSPSRGILITLFKFMEEVKPKEFVYACYRTDILPYFISKFKDVKIHLFTTKLDKSPHKNVILHKKYIEEKDSAKVSGLPLFFFYPFIFKEFNINTLFQSVVYNIEYACLVHKWLKPQFAYYLLRSYNEDINVQAPSGILRLMPYSVFSVTPNFIISCRTVEMNVINLLDVASRIQVFNTCSRLLNYSNAGDYLTYDQYM